MSRHGGMLVVDVDMSGQSITDLNPTPQNNNDAVTKSYVDNARWTFRDWVDDARGR